MSEKTRRDDRSSRLSDEDRYGADWYIDRIVLSLSEHACLSTSGRVRLNRLTLSVNRFIGLVNVSYYWSKHNQFSYLVLTFSVSIIRDLHQMKVFGRDRNVNKVRKSVVFWCLIYDISTTVVDLLIIWPVHHITKHRNWIGPTPSILKIGWDASLSSLLVIAPLGVLTPDRNDLKLGSILRRSLRILGSKGQGLDIRLGSRRRFESPQRALCLLVRPCNCGRCMRESNINHVDTGQKKINGRLRGWSVADR